MMSRPYADVISAVSLAVYIAIALNVALPGVLIDNEAGAWLSEKSLRLLKTATDSGDV